jgi:hypothetical protein
MLAYDHDCPNCGVREVLQRHQEHDICPDCGAQVRVIVAAVPTHGIVFSNAEVSTQLGTRWESNSEKRAWLKAHPKAIAVEKGSKEDTDFNMSIKQKQHDVLNSHGYKSVQEYKSDMTKKATSAKTTAAS